MTSSSIFPFWVWVGFSDRPVVMLVFQHAQILVDIHDSSYWPGPVWRRQKHQEAAALKETDRNRAGKSLQGERWEESESRRE